MNLQIPKRIFKGESQRNLFLTVCAVFVLSFLVAAFNDPLAPFGSFFFLVGCACVYFSALYFNVYCSLMFATMMAGLVMLQTVTLDGAPYLVGEVPFVGLFFFILALVPALPPALQQGAMERLKRESAVLDERDRDLTARLGLAQKAKTGTMRELVEQYDMRYSSRNATLVSFAREVIQYASIHEMTNALYKILTRAFQAYEIVQLEPGEGEGELVVSHVFPPNRKEYQSLVLPVDDELISGVIANAEAAVFDEPVSVGGLLPCHILQPCAADEAVVALFSLHLPDDRPDTDDVRFVQALTAVTGAAAGRLTRREARS